MLEISSLDDQETRALGRALGRAALAQGRGCVALDGPLGAGKTVLAQGIGEGLGLGEVPVSPTFIILAAYQGPMPLLHGDLFRVGEDDLPGLGLEEQIEEWPGLAVIEWACRHPGVLPNDHLAVEIQPAVGGRRLLARGRGPWSRGLLRAWRFGL